MKTGIVYRTQAKALKDDIESHNYNSSDEPQFEVCVFTDGSVAQRWLTAARSMVWWASWNDLCTVHIYAHPDYGTKIIWSDGITEEL